MPISFRSAFAAGAAAAAAQQAGKTEHEQLQQAQVTAFVVDAVDAKEAGKKAAPTPATTKGGPDALAAIEAARADGVRRDAPAHHKPTQPPGPGFLNHLARWLNLK